MGGESSCIRNVGAIGFASSFTLFTKFFGLKRLGMFKRHQLKMSA